MKLLQSFRARAMSLRWVAIFGVATIVCVPKTFVRTTVADVQGLLVKNHAAPVRNDDSPSNMHANLGNDSVIVPNISGNTQDLAANKLNSIGLRIDVRRDAARGLVISQSPLAGSSVKKEATRILKLSGADLFVRVPDVIGRLPEDAEDFLNAAGLRMEARGDLGHGISICQSPSAKTNVKRGTTVIVWFGLLAKSRDSKCSAN